jgi:hypothetical protein
MDCGIWMHTHSHRDVWVVIYRCRAELGLIVNEE